MECPPTLESYGVENVQLAPEREHQRINAALAVALCISWACRSPPSDSYRPTAAGDFSKPYWTCIAEVLSAAHSPESMEACTNWFCTVVKAKKGGSLKGKSNGTHCIEASSDVDDKEWNSRDIDQKRVPLHMALFVPQHSSTSVDKSSIAAVSHEERHAAHIELLSELKNSTGSGGQQEGCIVGS
ncbi:unnamed protein product [Sphagnum troendelagicum]|uniref:Uncharacterized protein n=1 Tax=Sphagnum troendelagicum TaxID=128251 RepID=A0ABP0URS7_9BRYO